MRWVFLRVASSKTDADVVSYDRTFRSVVRFAVALGEFGRELRFFREPPCLCVAISEH